MNCIAEKKKTLLNIHIQITFLVPETKTKETQ